MRLADGKSAHAVIYDVTSLLKQCITKYVCLIGTEEWPNADHAARTLNRGDMTKQNRREERAHCPLSRPLQEVLTACRYAAMAGRFDVLSDTISLE